ncbi:MAG: N-acetylmuramoyl-L-alanine amidase [Christensenella sp.]
MSKIYINPGHGGTDSGAVGINGRQEKDDTLRYMSAVADKLCAAGHIINLERDGDYLIPVKEIAERAEAWGAELFVAGHRNFGGGYGAECLIVSSASETTRRMAQEIQSRLVALGFRDRGVKVQDKNTYVLSHTSCPATTIECGFVDSADDNELFDSKFDDIVQAISDGILAAAGSAQPTPEPPQEPETPQEPHYEFALSQLVSRNSGSEDEVRAVQRTLIDFGYELGSTGPDKNGVDGEFGSKTKKAVIAFQRDYGLKPDGVVGENTCTALHGRWDG